MNRNLKLVINNSIKNFEEKYFFEKNELKIILDLYAKMVSAGSWKDYGLSISNRQVGFSVFKNATESALYKICKNFKPSNKNLKYLITDSNGKILNSNQMRNAISIATSFASGLKEQFGKDTKAFHIGFAAQGV